MRSLVLSLIFVLSKRISFKYPQGQGAAVQGAVLPSSGDVFPDSVCNWPALGTMDSGVAGVHVGLTFIIRVLKHHSPSSISVGLRDKIRVINGPCIAYGYVMCVKRLRPGRAVCVVSGWNQLPITQTVEREMEDGTRLWQGETIGAEICPKKFAVELPEEYVILDDTRRNPIRHLSIRLLSSAAGAGSSKGAVTRGNAGVAQCAGSADVV
jgi:hypothetical protein